MVGALASRKNALLPVTAAIGGMVFPGIVFFFFNHGTEAISGWAIPMATDIAFALGAIAVFGRKLPIGLRVFLTAFAIADDLGSVFVIALFYTKEIVWLYLVICIVLAVTIVIVNLLWIRWTPLYGPLGLGIWFSVLGSGVHPTVAGILVATLIPARGKYDTDQFAMKVNENMTAFKCGAKNRGRSILLSREHLNSVHALRLACHDVEPPLQHLEHSLHPWVAFVILPLFAFANAGLSLKGMDLTSAVFHPVTMGIVLGLFIGKPLGVALFAYLAVKTSLADLPEGVEWSHIVGAGMLGGIGFTISLFISGLSFSSLELLDYSKLGILIGSLLSAAAGLLLLGIDFMVNRHR